MKLNNRALLVIAALFGLVLTLGVMTAAFQHLMKMQQRDFDTQQALIAASVRSGMDIAGDDLSDLATAFYAANQVDPDSLSTHAGAIFARHSSIRRVIYASIVRDEQRRHFEAGKRDAGFISFRIRAFRHGQFYPVGQHPVYLPVTQVEPFDVDSASLLGLDLLAGEHLKACMDEAIRSGDEASVVTALADETPGLWLFRAIYAGFSGQSDPYFASHSQEMVNAMVGIRADIARFIKPAELPADMYIQLDVQQQGSAAVVQTVLRHGSMAPASWWAGLHFSGRVVFPLKQQQLVLHASRTLSWSAAAFLPFYGSAVGGLFLTLLLVWMLRARLQSEQRNRAILDSAMDAIINIDETGLVQEFNASAERIFGYTAAEAIGQNIAGLIIPEQYRQRHHDGMARYLSSGEEHVLGVQLEMRALRKGGEEFPVELNIVEVMGGKQRFFTAFLRDISSRKEAEEQSSRLATVVEQSFNAIIITDTDGIIRYVNPAFEKLSGYSTAAVIGQSPNIVKSGKHSKQYYQEMWQSIRAGKTWSGQFVNRARDGHLYHVEQTIFPLYVAGELVGYTAVQQDVTERDQLQEQSEHTQRLESLGVLAGGIAHDFNNLLTAIMGNAALAEHKLPDENPAAEHLRNIMQASESAATLCQQMLAYSGKGQFIVKPMNLSSTISEIVQLLESSIAKLVRLDVHLDYSLPAIDADESQMKQVIMNLVINASEAMADQAGWIEVSTSQEHLSMQDIAALLGAEHMQGGEYILLRVRDSGCGMDEDTRKKIFDPFFTTKFTGRGLGMSAILGIIRGHRGGLKVTSSVGEGSCFDVYFPVSGQRAVDTAPHAQPLLQAEALQATVLVVDDEAAVRELASMILQDMGLQVLLAEDGVQGLELVREQLGSIDLILLDMTMPRMGGEVFYKQLRQLTAELPVIISSGYAEEDIRSRFDAGVHIDFVQKPYHPAGLVARVSAMLSGKRSGKC